MRRKYTEKERSELVKLVTAGGATVSEAAARLGVTPSTAYYWTKSATAAAPWRARRSHGSSGWPPAAPAFARVVSSGEAGAAIVVRVGAAEIQVRRDFDAELLRGVVEALREVAA